MKKKNDDNQVLLYGHYRPHKRVQFTGELVNHKTGEIYSPPSRTKQSFKDECDINNILKQYGRTGMLNHVSARAAQGQYLDLPDEIDFQTSMNIVRQGEEAFASLPSKLRDRFNNDPATFLLFMADPANQDEAIKLGLATRVADPANQDEAIKLGLATRAQAQAPGSGTAPSADQDAPAPGPKSSPGASGNGGAS